MQLIYFRSRAGNFGDDLNPLIWPALAPELFGSDSSIGFVGIGTIIGLPFLDCGNLKVFSSGVGYDSVENNWRGKRIEYICVRGPISARILGLADELSISDGAILAPLVQGFPARASNGSVTSIVPHYQTLELGGWTEVADLTGFQLIDPRDDPVSVVSRIARSGLVLTESLHGAIMADLYGVPWVGFATSKHFGIPKWIDWTLSVGQRLEIASIPPPRPEVQMKYGRAPFPFGQFRSFSASDGLTRFETSVWKDLPPTFRLRVKSAVLKNSRLARSLLNLTPLRTAEALQRLVTRPVKPSSPGVYASLQTRMIERLERLRQNHS